MSDVSDKKPEAKTLEKLVAVTVIILSVFMAITKVKDDNIVQAMQKAKAESVDAWAEYQASRQKMHMAEHTVVLLKALGSSANAEEVAKVLRIQEEDIVKYAARSKETMARARSLEKTYEDLNGKDDQFDLSDVFTSIAIAFAAVAVLIEMWGMLYLAWASGGLGIALGLAAFMNWGLRIQWLIELLS